MRLPNLQTGTKILGAFSIVLLIIAIIASVALWRMAASDAITSDLVNDKLVRGQLTSDLLGLARLNGLRTVSIARSDSLEVSDYFQAQLAAGTSAAARIRAKLGTLRAAPAEQALRDAAAQRKAALDAVRARIFEFKDKGQTQQVETLLAGDLEHSFNAYVASLEALLEHQTRQAHLLAQESARASGFSRMLLATLGLAALAAGGAMAWLLTKSIVGPLQQAVALAEQVARGDLRPVIRHARADEIGRLFDALNRMTAGVSATVSRVLDGALEINRASGEIAAGSDNLSQRTGRQAGALKQTAASMAHLTAAVEQNNASAREANQLAKSASQVADDGARAVAQVVARMEAIKASADKIVDITGVIDGIAFQTNILALNAAVEAARAGPEGRGFAVVASEVRSLARHSAEAAKDIKQLIGLSAGEIVAGTGIANAAGSTMREVLERVQQVSAILASIHSASSEQACGIAEVGRAIADMDGTTRENAAMVVQAAAAAATMRDQAGQLTDLVATFKVNKAPALIA